jgi:hypothetical protein
MIAQKSTAPTLNEIVIMYQSILPPGCEISINSDLLAIDTDSASVREWIWLCYRRGVCLAKNHKEAITLWLDYSHKEIA